MNYILSFKDIYYPVLTLSVSIMTHIIYLVRKLSISLILYYLL